MTIFSIIAPEPRVVSKLAEDWMLFVLLLVIGLIGLVRWRFSKSFNDLFSSLVNLNKLREVMRQELVITSAASQILLVSAILSIGLFFYLALKILGQHLQFQIHGFLHYLLLVVAISFVYGSKFVFLKVCQSLFKGDYSINEYLFNVNLFLKLAGLVLIPLTVVMAYTSDMELKTLCYLGLWLIAISMFVRYSRGVVNALNSGVSLFYIILYLCTFEILPILSVFMIV